jgi:hypothetical protein
MKNLWKTTLAGLAAATLVAGAASTAGAATCGDINNNGSKAINDVLQLLQAVNNVGLQGATCGGAGYLNCADIDGGGTANIADVVTLLRDINNLPLCGQAICQSAGADLAGCPGTTTLPSDILVNTVIPAGCDARVSGVTEVHPPATLTVRAGATVKGTPGTGDASVLIILPGAKLNAVGNSAQPITFTSAAPIGSRAKEDWGGIVVLGKAKVHAGTRNIEGLDPVTFPEAIFGGNDDNDNSGCIRFTRVQFSGRDLTPDNELNLMVFGGVGRRTTVDHVHAHQGADDCFEWFGGTVNAKFLVASSCGDDNFDIQLGTRNAVQFGLIRQDKDSVESGGSMGFEEDNNGTGEGQDSCPRTAAKYCNVTACGSKDQGTGAGGTSQFGVLSRVGNASTIANSIISSFSNGTNGGGVTIRDASTMARTVDNLCALLPLNSDDACGTPGSEVFSIQNTIFDDNGSAGTLHAANHSSCDNNPVGECNGCTTTGVFPLWLASRGDVVSDGSFTDVCGNTAPNCAPDGGGNCFIPAVIPTVGSQQDTVATADCPSIDSSFTSTDYVGGFAPGGADWTSPWASYPAN